MSLLEDIAKRLLQENTTDYSRWTIVFPNKRAGLYFKRLLSQQIKKPVWSPQILSINEIFEKNSPYTLCDKFSLIYKLYQIISKYHSENETFEQFFFWGETLLADFDEIDKFLIDARLLFRDLSYIKEIESNLSHLNENQIEIIKKFWKSFEGVLTKEQEKTLSIWKILWPVYRDFKDELNKSSQAFPGMMHRWVVGNLGEGIELNYPNILFAGFNALSTTEEKLISWCRQNLNCELFWDAHDFYLNDEQQEAGEFLRSYKKDHPILSPTFRKGYNNGGFSGKNIEVVECSTDAGQAQETGKILEKLVGSSTDPEKIAIVLPDEKLLLPVLNTIPEKVDSLNITMGYPLKNSLAYSFLLGLIELQKNDKTLKSDRFYYKNVFKVLSHPFIFNRSDNYAKELIAQIKKDNILFPSLKILQGKNEAHHLIFKKVGNSVHLIDYLLDNLLSVTETVDETSLESEFILHFYKLLNNLKELFLSHSLEINYKSFLRLLNHAIYRERLPFEGEPLNGLQIMGLMETRNLSFEHLIILSTNEGILPPARQDVSFIPYSIRKAYNLPTIDHADAIYAYLFYRLIHNCQNITILYNGSSERGKSGELSRYVKQLMVETDFTFQLRTQDIKVYPIEISEIRVSKNSEILDRLSRYVIKNQESEKRLSPSAFNTYLDCSLKFYYRYVLDLYEDEEVEENIQERELGLLFHRVMELVYKESNRDENRRVDSKVIQLKKSEINQYIDQAFGEYYHFADSKEMLLSGQSELAYDIIKELALQVLTIDEDYAPFEIIGLEADEKKGYKLGFEITVDSKALKIGLKGIIDRIDQKDGVTRILDYKTGKDVRIFSDIDSLFDRDNKNRNKAVFQTFLYSLIFLEANPGHINPIQMGLFNLRDIFSNDFNPIIQMKDKNSATIPDIRPFLDEYNNQLKELLQNIFDPDIDFIQTNDIKKCKFCPYIDICHREEN